MPTRDCCAEWVDQICKLVLYLKLKALRNPLTILYYLLLTTTSPIDNL